MIGGRQPFIFARDGLIGMPTKGMGPPFVPVYSRIRETPGDPYPDAFLLPKLPLPLIMLVPRLRRFMGILRRVPAPAQKYSIAGITKDVNSAALPGCVVHLFQTANDIIQDATTSGADGSYAFTGAAVSPALDQYAVAYKPGSPDVAGTTVNTLRGV